MTAIVQDAMSENMSKDVCEIELVDIDPQVCSLKVKLEIYSELNTQLSILCAKTQGGYHDLYNIFCASVVALNNLELSRVAFLATQAKKALEKYADKKPNHATVFKTCAEIVAGIAQDAKNLEVFGFSGCGVSSKAIAAYSSLEVA